MFGSAASLHEIAVADHLAAAWTMPVCLDLLAIATTTAATAAVSPEANYLSGSDA